MLLSGAAVVIYNKIGEVMLGNMLDKVSVGYFSVASRFVEICIFIPTIISQTITPILVKHHKCDINRYNQQTKIYCATITWCSIIVAIITCLISTPIIKYTFGPAYMASVPILQVLAFKAVGAALMQSSGQMIIIEGLQKYAVLRNGIACIVCILGNLILIPILGATGAALSGVSAFFVAGYLANAIIPSYKKYVPIQTYGLFMGWKHLLTKTKRDE
jgi:O-antigen/teichoic acid export membrane protein